MKSDLVKNLKKSKKIILVVAATLTFWAILLYVLFVLQSDQALSPQPAVSVDTTYQEYKEYISSTNKGIKALLEGEQLERMEFYGKKDINVEVPRKDNPFGQSF